MRNKSNGYTYFCQKSRDRIRSFAKDQQSSKETILNDALISAFYYTYHYDSEENISSFVNFARYLVESGVSPKNVIKLDSYHFSSWGAISPFDISFIKSSYLPDIISFT